MTGPTFHSRDVIWGICWPFLYRSAVRSVTALAILQIPLSLCSPRCIPSPLIQKNTVVVHSVVSESLQPHEPQHARLHCPSLSPRVCSNSCPPSQWYHPTILSVAPLSSCLQSFPASESFPMSQLFPNNCALHIKRPKFWSFTFSISPSNEYSGLISFRIDWFGLFAAHGTVKSLLQYHSSEASILQHSTFFMVQHSHLYMTTGKTMALTTQTFTKCWM